MSHLAKIALAAVLLLPAAGAAWAGTTVTYTDPEQFADIPFSIAERERVLKELSAHFAKLGAQLPPGQDLTINVTDVDLAGRMTFSRRGNQEIRLLTGGADWPRIHLQYRLESGGQLVGSGDADLSDMMYLNHLNFYSMGETLRYEKQMIDEWFSKTFGVKARARG
ncbi:MAG: DUF3016 domain-containing protein [Pseudomonadota bacterium]